MLNSLAPSSLLGGGGGFFLIAHNLTMPKPCQLLELGSSSLVAGPVIIGAGFDGEPVSFRLGTVRQQQ